MGNSGKQMESISLKIRVVSLCNHDNCTCVWWENIEVEAMHVLKLVSNVM